MNEEVKEEIEALLSIYEEDMEGSKVFFIKSLLFLKKFRFSPKRIPELRHFNECSFHERDRRLPLVKNAVHLP